MTTKRVVKLVKNYMQKYTSFDDHDASVATGYVMATWLYRRYSEVKYLRIEAPVGYGNTATLRAVGSVCFNPVFMYGMSSQRSLLYALAGACKEGGATMCLDDVAYKLVGEGGNPTTFAKIMNAGTLSNNFIVEAEKANRDVTYAHYNVFCPKIIVKRNSFDNPSLDSRFITVQGKQREHIPAHDLLNAIDGESKDISNAISDWATSINKKKQVNPSFLGLVFALSGIQTFLPITGAR